jgi:hypothetical protein
MTHEHGPLCTLDWGDLIQIADPDILLNPAKQEIEMEKQLSTQEIRIANTSNFETILTIRELKIPTDTIELKFDTVFVGAKDPQARQTKAQFFIDRDQLQKIHLALLEMRA